MFGANKKKPADFNGGRTAQAVVQEAQRVATQIVTDRLGGKSSGGSGGSGGGGGSGGKNAVVELTDSNFKKLVMDSDDMWLVSCGRLCFVRFLTSRGTVDLATGLSPCSISRLT